MPRISILDTPGTAKHIKWKATIHRFVLQIPQFVYQNEHHILVLFPTRDKYTCIRLPVKHDNLINHAYALNTHFPPIYNLNLFKFSSNFV